jgi:hypothetical protein
MNFFGEDRPERAAMTIVMMKALVSLMGSTTPGMDALQRHLVSAGVSQWWSDQTLSNTVVIKGRHVEPQFCEAGRWHVGVSRGRCSITGGVRKSRSGGGARRFQATLREVLNGLRPRH